MPRTEIAVALTLTLGAGLVNDLQIGSCGSEATATASMTTRTSRRSLYSPAGPTSNFTDGATITWFP